MKKEKYKVKFLLKFKGKTIGAELVDITNLTIHKVPKSKFSYYKNDLENAIVTIDGVIRGKHGSIPTKETEDLYIQTSSEYINLQTSSESNQQRGKVKKYVVMYEDKEVLLFDKETDEVIVYNQTYLPFSLRNKNNISAVSVSEWLTNRLSNINRTYMNMVYIARKVGRDRDKVIKDSSGVSFTDNFWIKTSDVTTTWVELKQLRDENRNLNHVALTGKIRNRDNLLKGFTSLFTTKGYFAKAILGGYLYKRKEDSILEYPAYLIGHQLGINVSECCLESEYVKIKIFTDYSTSLVHASELKDYYDTNDEIYNCILKSGRRDIARQFQRMFIFNYIIGNPDLHDDNYGLLYNAKTFELISLAPCFDHNVAFQEGFDGLSRTTMGNSASAPLDDWSELFIKKHSDIVDKLKKIDLTEIKKYLNSRQLKELKERISNIIMWFNQE